MYRRVQYKYTDLLDPVTMGRDLSRRNPFDHASLSNEETRDVKKELVEIEKKFDGAEELNANTINNHEKSSQLMTFRRNQGTSYN